MISFKAFVEAVHDAILRASDSLKDRNVGLLDKYFEETPQTASDGSTGTSPKSTLKPKNVILEYPVLTHEGKVETTEIQVPLITMVPLSTSQIEKATLTAEFILEIVDNELQLNFPGRKSNGMFQKKRKTTNGKLEIVISPQEPSEGLKLIVEAFDAALKRQIP
jgi:hypothetical protein